MALAAPLSVIVVPALAAALTVPEMLAVAEMVMLPAMFPTEAEIVDWPTPAAVAMALVSRLTAAESEETQTAELVTFCVLPSLKVPVAVNLSCVPLLMCGFAGVIAIETRCAVEIFKAADPLTAPMKAVIVVLPLTMPDASP